MLKHPDLTRRRIEAFLNTLRGRLWHTQVPLRAEVYQPAGPPRDYRDVRIDPAEIQALHAAPTAHMPPGTDLQLPTTSMRSGRARSIAGTDQPPDTNDQLPSASQPPSTASFTPVEPGFAWGPIYSDAWFRFTGAVPAEWKGQVVAARIDPGAEAILWEGDDPVQGIDPYHGEVRLFAPAQGGEPVQLMVQANGMNPFVNSRWKPKPVEAKPFVFAHAWLAVVDEPLWAFYYDMNVAFGVMCEQLPDSHRYGELLYALNAAINLYNDADAASIEPARGRLAGTYQRPAAPSAYRASAIGHAHIDTAWLWTLERTQTKCLRTFASAVRLMERYPEYRFLCSQPVQYAWVKQLAPRLYARIQEKVKSGQWEVAGSMWTEADCNVPSGESLIRQIVHGKRYFRDEFGIETRDLWLPDVFGYSAALPQILKKAGIDYFLTQKISWNQVNRFPHHTFYWQGIDGTRIFSHFPPADKYNALMLPSELAFAARNFAERDRADRWLFVFGPGDGGGGPNAEMLESARRLRDVEGMPRLEMEPAANFFRKAEAEATDLPVWVGELYLELHRGTYTTHADNKRGNRKSELLLRDAEFLSVVSPEGLAAYPLAELDAAWKTVLLNQFHDIIPGSSVGEVYTDSDRDYAEVASVTGEIIDRALSSLAAPIDTRGMRRPVLVVSNLSHFPTEVVEVPIGANESPVAAFGPEGETTPVQIVQTADGGRAALFVAKNVPLHGYGVWDLGATYAPDTQEGTVTVTPTSLENDALLVELDQHTGLITRIYDKDSEREVLAIVDLSEAPNWGTGEQANRRTGDPTPNTQHPTPNTEFANQLWLFEDKPVLWDAWDIDLTYQEKGRLITEMECMEVVEAGPVRGAMRIVRAFGKSRLTQTIRLTAGSARIDFVTEVDWHETDTLLKAAFPVAINSARATYEIQYGHVERPTHYNTSWDMARYEVCAQRWADLSEGDYGVALLNDCKYGYDTQGDTLRLTLLRAPKSPDPQADMGHHQFTYALLPHGGDFREGEVVEHAYALNCPPRVRALPGNRPGRLPVERSFFEIDNANVFIEAIKRAEQTEAVIVRLYEAHNTRGLVTLTTTLPVRRAALCDLLEREVADIPISGGEMTLPVQPFEIVTVKLLLD